MGKKHRARRGLENKVFRRGFFSHYEKDVFPKTLALTIDQFVSNGGGDLVEFGFRALINLTCDFAGWIVLRRAKVKRTGSCP